MRVGSQWTDPNQALVTDLAPPNTDSDRIYSDEDRFDFVGKITLGGSIATTGDQLFVGGEIELTGQPDQVLRTETGTVNLIPGLNRPVNNGDPILPNPIGGIEQVQFSQGFQGQGFGGELQALFDALEITPNFDRDDPPPVIVPPAPGIPTEPGAQPPVTDDSVTAEPSAPRAMEAGAVMRDLTSAGAAAALNLDADTESANRGRLLVADVTAGAIRGLRESLEAAATSVGFTSVLRFDQPITLPSAQAFVFEMPANTFMHSDANAVISYSARLADGSALPVWLSFQAAGLTFSGTAPEGVEGLRIEILAEDAQGNVESTFVELVFTP